MQSMYANSILSMLKFSFIGAFIAFIFLIFFLNTYVSAQNESESIEENFDVTKSKSHESFVVPFSASNTDRKNPVIYTYEIPKDVSWILGIENN